MKWIGHRHLNLVRSTNPERLLPIRIGRGAIAENVPQRDLFISPDHAMYLDGVLIPASALINGATITQSQECKEITYFHVELEAHGIVLAEGAAAESYIDTGNRGFFANAPGTTVLRPVSSGPSLKSTWLGRRLDRVLAVVDAARFYRRHAAAPWVCSGRRLERVRRKLVARAVALGYRLVSDPDLALLADARMIRPEWVDAKTACFAIPPGVTRLRLLSRSAVPAEVLGKTGDLRRLGVAIERLVFDTADGRWVVPAANDLLRAGFYPADQRRWHAWRWTDGGAVLPHQANAQPVRLEIHLGPANTYWSAPALAETAEARRA